jgi:hypothetical protein
MGILVSMGGFAVNDKYVSLLYEGGFVVDDMLGMPVQHNDEFREVDMLMQFDIFLVLAIMNKERELLVLRKPFQIRDAQPYSLPNGNWMNVYIMLLYDLKIKVKCYIVIYNPNLLMM